MRVKGTLEMSLKLQFVGLSEIDVCVRLCHVTALDNCEDRLIKLCSLFEVHAFGQRFPHGLFPRKEIFFCRLLSVITTSGWRNAVSTEAIQCGVDFIGDGVEVLVCGIAQTKGQVLQI